MESESILMSAFADYDRSIRRAMAIRGKEMDPELFREILNFVDTGIRILQMDAERRKGE